MRKHTYRPWFERLESRAMLSIVASHLISHTPSPIYSPDVIRHAYGLDTLRWNGAGQTIAVVEAFGDPNLASDLHHFDQLYGLPDPPKLTHAGGGGPDVDWGVEEALDVEWAHAIAPRANILVEETGSADLLSLADAAFNAAERGADAVSMSFGGGEFNGESSFDFFFTQTGLPHSTVYLASSGDTGGVVPYPSASPSVLSTGGTSLFLSNVPGHPRDYGSERAWIDGGGGPAMNEKNRRTPDVSFDSDPNTGVPVYDTGYTPSPGLLKVGGTSFAAPAWAGIIALTDQARGKHGPLGNQDVSFYLYHHPTSLHDITQGTNRVYHAGNGYDLATGLGTPIGSKLIPGLAAQPHLRAPRSTGQAPTQTEPVTPFWEIARG